MFPYLGVPESSMHCRFGIFVEAQRPTRNPELPKKKRRVYTNFFEKFARTFAFFPVTRVRTPDGNCSEKLVQINFFFLGGFFRVDFPALNLGSSSAKWWFSLLMIWGFGARESRPHDRALSAPRHCLDAH